MSRADRISPKEKMPEYYADFSINMDKNPVTGLLARLTNEEAVKQSIINLVLTSQHERFYAPYTGSKVKHSLFELADPIVIEDIKRSIVDVIENYEPRAQIVQIDVRDDIDRNGYDVAVHFSIQELKEINTAVIFLERVR